ncbi:MAG: mechanosensitive ion channel [Anaerolineae bacterium]|jgi:small-conductance mechanosensitive channel|nr:mechanosensitive ion channel [Anaerolineae bacterium]MBT4311433.1 mechanosensitive ion channel [Anaerolineae bacterium]MBT4459160.1 mechanosensitive ion channel [Anaerolineae bacterium]MBT4841475.1 mechanosensitive ion channel [Anaerolineae bacterium]MBT6061626.1 mechanosensitive ion channel [Anaerolineae bacterium]
MNWSTLTQENWIDIGISVLIFFATAFLGRWVIKFIFRKIISRFTKHTKTTFDDVLIESIAPPLYWLALVYAFQISLNRLGFIFDKLDFELDSFYFVLFWLIGTVVAWRLIANLAKWYEEQLAATQEVELGEQLMPFLRRLLLIVLIVIAAIIFLGYFNIEVGGMVATLGIGSLAIALAAQATLSDTINGFVIMFDRPFRIGDRIEVQDLSTWGDVVDIGLRSTRIRTRDNRMVILPNSVIGKSLIVNHSYPNSEYRIQIHVGVAYGTDIELARETIVSAVKTVEGVLTEHPVEALFLEFGDSALVFRARWWLESYADTRRMFDKVNTAIYKNLNEVGIEIPFPQRVITYKPNTIELGADKEE